MVSELDVRKLALALPEVTSVSQQGLPAFAVAEQTFAALRESELLLLAVGGIDERDFLIAAQPERFLTTAGDDGQANVLVRLAALNRGELGALLEDAWSVRAPRPLVAKYRRGD